MAEIIQFPSQDERNWPRIETLIREQMEAAQAPEVVIDKVLSWLKDLWLRLREQPIHFQSKPPEGCKEAIEEGIYAVVNQMDEKLILTMLEAAGQKTRLEMLKYEHNL